MNRRGLLFSLGAVALVAVLQGCASMRPAESLRVATYNIRLVTGKPGSPDYWDTRKHDLVALVKQLDLDVFGMQEVCPKQMAYFRDTLDAYTFVGDHRGADRKSDEASPVAYRTSRFIAEKSGTFWLSETPEVPASKSWGTACTRVCTYLLLRDRRTGKRFCFANTHTDHISAEAREKGMLLVIARMKAFGENLPIVFTGDHNCRETEAPAQAVSKRLDNALYRSETPPTGSWRTWNGWRWRETEVTTAEALALSPEARNSGEPRIDYIYVTPGVRVLDYATINATRADSKMYPSDHFPVVSTILLP